ncbi:ArgS-related anticodon-binding protein NrtL [Streptomyces gamaensis]|uniref:arginine--tRNA ligase n=1 Tax=Streptomyces gamaensis TaxID=1763542 RepID=A0ABW0Z0Y3_9ACTN
MTPADLSRTVLHTVRRAVEADELRADVPARVGVRVPPHPGCGDYATSVALPLAKAAGRPAREVAEVLRRRLVREPGIARVDIAGPGFLNITLADVAASHEEVVRSALRLRDHPAEPLPLDEPDPQTVVRLGPDAARWSLLCPPGFDRAGLLVQRESNPLFKVRYAHSRCRALLRNAADLGFGPCPATGTGNARTGAARTDTAGTGNAGTDRPATDSASTDQAGTDQARQHPGPYGPGSGPLLALLADHPRITARRDPDRLARHLERLADAFLRWQARCATLPRGDEKPSAVHRARLALAEATGAVLADGLHQLGITAPDRL